MRSLRSKYTATLLITLCALARVGCADASHSFADTINSVLPKIVKIYGAGGFGGLESYQSGFLISADGHVLTVWSYVLDTENVTVVLDDGRKFTAEKIGADPRLEIAVLKVDTNDLAFFDRKNASSLDVGARVLAFSNLYGVATGNEPASVLHGSVAAQSTLSARRGAYKTLYDGPVYVVDAMTNNAGAAGGALTDRRGQLAGILGKELKNAQSNIWLNYAIPINELNAAIDDILAGKVRSRNTADSRQKPKQPVKLDDLGIVLLPDVLYRTPPFIQYIQPDSAADKAGLKPDDLIVYIDTVVIQSRKELVSELGYIDQLDEVRLTIQRGQKLLQFELIPQPEKR